MKKIKSFSFRYGEPNGNMEWFRVEDDDRAICLRVDIFDGEEKVFFREVDEDFLERLERAILKAEIPTWDGFYNLEAGICSGSSWVLHIFYQSGEEVHAMGHAACPDGFAEGKAALEAIFYQESI